MKRILPFMLLAGIVMLGACKEKKQSTDIITTKYVPKKPQPPIAMASDSQSRTVQWQGQSYTVVVDRVASDSLPLVHDESNQPYKDNQITVTVKRGDGSPFFKRVFTKSSFASYVDDSFRRSGILAGIRYDEIDNGRLEFSVVIALPDAIDDVFVPLELSVDRHGQMSVARDDDMDMLGYEEDEGV